MPKQIPHNLIAWLPPDYREFSQKAIDRFHAVTGQGRSSYFDPITHDGFTSQEMIQFKEMLDAHAASSRVPSGIVEGIWADGLADYPIRLVLQDMIRDGAGNPSEWMRKLPVYERAYRFSVSIHKERIMQRRAT